MASSYPGALDNFATDKADATATATDHPAHHNDLADAVNKIEAELGTDPAGSESTVAARLAALEAAGFDLGTLTLLTRPTMVGAKDDQFNAGTLDGKWTTGYSGAGSVDLATMPGWVSVTAGTAILQAVPAGSWVIEAEIIGPASNAAAFTGSGLIVTSGTAAGSASDVRFGLGMDNSTTSYRVVWEKFVNGAFNTTFSAMAASTPANLHQFLRLSYNSGSGQITPLMSPTGFNFNARHAATTPGFTPTHFGIYAAGFCNYFRVV